MEIATTETDRILSRRVTDPMGADYQITIAMDTAAATIDMDRIMIVTAQRGIETELESVSRVNDFGDVLFLGL